MSDTAFEFPIPVLQLSSVYGRVPVWADTWRYTGRTQRHIWGVTPNINTGQFTAQGTDCGIMVRLPEGAWEHPVLQDPQTGSGAHSVATVGLFPRDKVVWMWGWPLPPPVTRLRMSASISSYDYKVRTGTAELSLSDCIQYRLDRATQRWFLF